MSKLHPVLAALLERAKLHPARIVLPEGHEKRIQDAAITAARMGIAKPMLLGDVDRLTEELGEAATDSSIEIIDPHKSEHRDALVDAYVELRAHKGATTEMAKAAMQDPMQFAAMLVRQGLADATIGGAVASTADTGAPHCRL